MDPQLEQTNSSNIRSRLFTLANAICQITMCMEVLGDALQQQEKPNEWCNAAVLNFYYAAHKVFQTAAYDNENEQQRLMLLRPILQQSKFAYEKFLEISLRNYRQNFALNYCITRLQDTEIKQYEHFVGSWATTMVTETFNNVKREQGGPNWIFTSEQTDQTSKKRPDFTVEKMEDKPEPTPWLYMEYKRFGGKPTYMALNQLSKAVESKLYEDHFEGVFTIYLVVVAGVKISFWEIDYEAVKDKQPERDVEFVWGCRSLTQSAEEEITDDLVKEPPYTIKKNNIPPGVEKLITRQTTTTTNPVLVEAREYETKAVWDITNTDHKEPIFKMFNHMARNKPRPF